MSNAVLNDVWQQPTMKGNDLLVLLVLADMADDDSRMCWPSVETICRKSNMGRSTAYQSLQRLAEEGFIEEVMEDEWPPSARRYRSVVRRIRTPEEWSSSNSSRIGTPSDAPLERPTSVQNRDGSVQDLDPTPNLTPSSSTPETSSLSLDRDDAVATTRPRRRSRPEAWQPTTKPTRAQRAAAAQASEDESDPFKVILASDEPDPEPEQVERPSRPRTRSRGPAQQLVGLFVSHAKQQPNHVPGSVNQAALAGSFAAWLREGHSYADIRGWVDLYWSDAWEGQRAAHKPAWQDFLARRGAVVATDSRIRENRRDVERRDEGWSLSAKTEEPGRDEGWDLTR